MSERTDLACDSCSAPTGKRCHPDCRNYEEDDPQETAEEVALGHRVAYLESELERIRPVYEAACVARDKAALYEAVKANPPEAALIPAWMERCTETGSEWIEATKECDAAVDRARTPR